MLAEFRAIVRGLSPDHGIRVGKWLGDGCMFVGTEVRPVVETVLDLVDEMEDADIVLPLRIGIAAGQGDRVRGRRLHRHADQPRVAPRATPPRPARCWCPTRWPPRSATTTRVVPLGERQFPGIVAPVEVWRLDTTPEVEDDLPLSFAE